MARRFGLFVLGRPTFDVEYANARASEALAALAAAGIATVGDPAILFDNDAVAAQIAAVAEKAPDGIIVVQATFTDAGAISTIAARFDAPVHIWALPEPRLGGRLRLNGFCGLNLAAHALGLRNKPYIGLYEDPGAAGIDDRIAAWLARDAMPAPLSRPARDTGDATAGARGIAALKGTRIGRIGQHPDGFDTCTYDDDKLAELADIAVDPIALEDLFAEAAAVPAEALAETRAAISGVAGLSGVDQPQLEHSLRLKAALDRIRKKGGYSGFAIRCWPETFTEYGGAVCGPVAMMGEKHVPCACEADVYGALTTLMLQEIAGTPAFLADIVDMDAASDTTVLWHCGLAPRDLANPEDEIAATIHSNRKMPLLFQFTLKPGRVTLARLSQARGHAFLAVATGEVLAAPRSFTGTSGVVRLDAPAQSVRERLLGAALEHHVALVYGDHADALEYVAHALNMPILDLTK